MSTHINVNSYIQLLKAAFKYTVHPPMDSEIKPHQLLHLGTIKS